ncbi:MAG: hypothetical protein WBD41_17620 [Rhodococcus sp. (in: high G+C Gram-positive bacteria)]|jgi:hypothetical protein|nr:MULTISPECIES: hypothetical protein [Rhodococcus]SCC70085.1 hypothetical protein GA0061093_13247 [Rhodococcus qingshengii]
MTARPLTANDPMNPPLPSLTAAMASAAAVVLAMTAVFYILTA